ncbi:MAG: AAA family ATPase [Bacteroidales bacterium]|nr:AAA family ATPase [Bacteroidales bacterium]
MDKLFQYSSSMVNAIELGFKRYLWDTINWQNRLIVIVGARGVGKTTLLLQYIKENFSLKPEEVIYASLDDLYFSKNSLVNFAGEFVKRGGKYLFLDEVHKYKNWSQELKSSYDYFPELKMVVTGSSALNIYKGNADLSRRAILYKMNGLSFREFIELKHGIKFPVLLLEEILENSTKHIHVILQKIKPIRLFEEYIRRGYYPFFSEGLEEYHLRIKQIVNHVLDVELPSVERIDFNAVHHLRTLLSVVSEIVPYKPNILKLSNQVGVSRETLVRYLYLLERADLLMMLKSGTSGISQMNKPEKVYLHNTNLSFTLANEQANAGSNRETFFYNQLKVGHKVSYAPSGDFVVDNIYTFEVGGKNKQQKQIEGINKAYIAADNIEYSYQNRIPLWLFGFLY